MENGPYLRKGGWFIDIDGDISGPWNNKESAVLAASSRYEQAHVAEWQYRHGITVDGIAGPKTLEAGYGKA